MQIAMGSVLTSSVWSNIAIVTLDGIVGVEILEIRCLWISKLRSRFDKRVFGTAARVGAFGDVNGTIEAVSLSVAFAMVRLKLSRSKRRIHDTTAKAYFLQKREQFIGAPTRCLPRIEVGSLSSGVNHPVHCRSAAKGASRGYDGRSIRQLRRLFPLPKKGDLATGEEIPRIERWVDNFRHTIVVRALLNDQNDQVTIRFCQA